MHMHDDDLREDILKLSGTNPKKCMKCGKCSATCPALEFMDIHPHRFVRSIADGKVKELMTSKTLWTCLSCYVCSERCPRDVEPAALIESVRTMVIRQQGANYIGPDDIPEIIECDEDIPQQLVVSAFRKYLR